MKRLQAAAIALMSLCAAWAAKGEVWDNPTTEYGTYYGDGFFIPAIDVTRVELGDTETAVHMTVNLRSDYPNFSFKFAKDTYILANGKQYPVVSADGIEFDKDTKTGADGKLDIVFRFPPLPKDTKAFDFIEGDWPDAIQVKGIRPVEERHKMLIPSYWRNEKTGDWEIAFLGDHAIYDCKVWDMAADINAKSGEANITLTNNGKTLAVKVGKNKNGKRTIDIDGKKGTYEMITNRFMPDYPTKDTRTDFVDTDYKMDSATVVGWIMDMPEPVRNMKTFNVQVHDFYLYESVDYVADLDSLGRFSIKVPLWNSSEAFLDWERCVVHTMLEPGKTYFLLYDFKEGRRLWMGDDARLQNELFRFPLDWKKIRYERGEDFDKYLASADSLIKAQHAYADSICAAHPTLSTRFNLYRKGNSTWEQAYLLCQAHFWCEEHKMSDNIKQYAFDNFWTKMPKPYTLHRDFRLFLYYYLDEDIGGIEGSINTLDFLDELVESPEEAKTLRDMNDSMNAMSEKVLAIEDEKERERVANEYIANNVAFFQKRDEMYNAIISRPKAQDVIRKLLFLKRLQSQLHKLDSIGADQTIKDMWVAKSAYGDLDQRHLPLHQESMDSVRAWIANPQVLAGIEAKNEYYVALANKEFDKLALKTNSNVQGMTEGKEILDKLLEPYKGKIVLIDIWGTWCGPCKEALSHSQEEYARLADYDIQFVYFANHSPNDIWETIIKEHNVTGDNVTHFNLGDAEQEAIERYLRINGFPTFKLVDKQGNVLDMKVDARNLDALEQVIKTLSEQ